MKILDTPHMERCTGCHSCSLACARLVYGRLSWETAGIRIYPVAGPSAGFDARRCLACKTRPCAIACPTGALSGRTGGGVLFSKELCTRCGDCVPACPVSGILQYNEGPIFVCIHCGQCVDYCPHGCLEMVDVHDTARSQEEVS